MKKCNVNIVFNKENNKLLFCKRISEPYLGKYNLVGGKVEPNEDDLESAYRELKEESAITRNDIKLIHLMDLFYYMSDIELQVYVGILNKEVNLIPEKHPLEWIDANDNFYDLNKYAGEGNIGHMISQVKIHYDKIFKD